MYYVLVNIRKYFYFSKYRRLLKKTIANDRGKIRVARWFIFKPKISICVNFVMPQIWKCWYILRPSVFYGHSGCSMTIWYIFGSFGTFIRFRFHVPTLGKISIISTLSPGPSIFIYKVEPRTEHFLSFFAVPDDEDGRDALRAGPRSSRASGDDNLFDFRFVRKSFSDTLLDRSKIWSTSVLFEKVFGHTFRYIDRQNFMNHV
jgi:hypothetical protein